MNKRLLYLLGITLGLFIIAQSMSWWVSRPGLPHYAQKIETYLQDQEAEVRNLLEKDDFFIQLYTQHRSNYKDFPEEYFRLLEGLAKKDFAFYLLAGDSLIAWTQHQIQIPEKWLPSQLNDSGPVFASSKSGYFTLFYKTLPYSTDTLTILGAIPIKKVYPLESPYLKSGFTADLLIPATVELSSGEGIPVKNGDGKFYCFLQEDQPTIDPTRQIWILSCFALAFLLLLFSFNRVAIIIGKKYHYLYGLGMVLLTALSVRFSILHLLFGKASIWNLFTAHLALEGWNKPLIDLLISSLLLIWCATFFHREYVTFFRIPETKWGRWGVAASAFLLIIGALTLTNFQFKHLILDSGLNFDFHTVFNLDLSSFVAICCLLLLLVSLFLFSHRIMLIVFSLDLKRDERIKIALVCILASLPLLLLFSLSFPLLTLGLISLIFVLCLELFIESNISSLTWLVFWLFLCAFYAAGLLYKYKLDKDLNTQLTYAKALANPQDVLAEPQMAILGMEVGADTSIWQFFESLPKDSVLNNQRLRTSIDRKLIEKNYLFNNYAYQFHVFEPSTLKSYLSSPLSLDFLRVWRDTTLLLNTPYEELFLLPTYDNELNYLYLDKELRSMGGKKMVFALSFKFKTPNPSKVYTELLLDAPYKGLKELNQFDYVVYEGKRAVFSNKSTTDSAQPKTKKLPPNTHQAFFTSTRSDIYYQGDNNLSVLIGKPVGGYTKPWSLFSYLFALFILMVLLIALFNYFFPSLPPDLGFRLTGRRSLRNRIQLAVIALVLGSFLIIGIVTVTFFSQSSDSYHSSRLNRKVSTIQQDIQRDLKNYKRNWPKGFDLEALITSTSNIHNMDINYFDLDGRLVSSSTRFIFDRNITAPLMNPVALKGLKQPTISSFFIEEKIGGLAYRSAYVPLRNGQREIIAYLGLPYYSKGRDLRSDLYDFMGTLLNVYVLLLLVAGVIAIVVANSVTNPISKIGEQLSRFELGQSEPLEWKNKDEIGQLIAEYNQMIQKLEESTAKLKQSEREGAWREMAKQVAHEIKNPLTPMKLSIQHLLRVQQTQPERAAEMMDKVAVNLIEQIENLARIASEFSNFAKMPKAQQQILNLNEVITSVYHIFRETPDGSDILQLDLPEQEVQTFADKGQIIQVLNNLIKNAIQAIPDDRQGEITLQLQAKTDTAYVIVQDNGAGIPQHMIEKVFSPNFTTKTSGMGLGLAISKNIIDATGGKIYFTTKANQGTTFFIELPIYTE